MSDNSIKRSDAIEAIEGVDWYHQNKNKDMVSGANSDEHQAWYKADDVYKALEAIPTIEPKRGEWIDMGDFEKCSVCKGTHLKEFQSYYGKTTWIKTPYCPHCGARMKGADDE